MQFSGADGHFVLSVILVVSLAVFVFFAVVVFVVRPGGLDASSGDVLLMVGTFVICPLLSTLMGVLWGERPGRLAAALTMVCLSAVTAGTFLGLDAATANGLCDSLPCPVRDGSVPTNAVIGTVALGVAPAWLYIWAAGRLTKHPRLL